jgi:hypothetical protein
MIKGAYNGTQGYVQVDTSIERLTPNLESVMVAINERDLQGMTWKELALYKGWHHGQASGALSNLHKLGYVFTTSEKRNGCHVYVDSVFNSWWEDEERNDKPVRTKASLNKQLQAEVINAALAFVNVDDEQDVLLMSTEAKTKYADLVYALDNYLENK